MAREKNQRKLNFKPIVKSYIPESKQITGVTNLFHEEIEAIYLMDVLGLYQEDAAKSMEVSRPTFTRILKNARKKLASALVSGAKIIIEDNKKDEFIIAFCTDNLKEPHSIDLKQEFIVIYKITDDSITLIESMSNPIVTKKEKPAIILPQILLEKNVNIFISSLIGEGLKNTLATKGIKPLVTKSTDLNTIIKEL